MHSLRKRKQGNILGGTMEPQARIEETGRQIQKDYRKTLAKVQKLKNKMNELEQHAPKTRDLKTLDLAIKRLNKLTDSQILRSKKAWIEYRKLEQECKQCTLCPVQLDDLRAICKKTEELAADLLCYSLARFEQSERQSQTRASNFSEVKHES
jgi:ABC-type phosphate transport system auxiliary subunit